MKKQAKDMERFENFIEKWAAMMRLMLIGISPQACKQDERDAAEREFINDAKYAFGIRPTPVRRRNGNG